MGGWCGLRAELLCPAAECVPGSLDSLRARQVLVESRQLLLLEQLASVPGSWVLANAAGPQRQQAIKVDARGHLAGGVPAWPDNILKAEREAVRVGHRFAQLQAQRGGNAACRVV